MALLLPALFDGFVHALAALATSPQLWPAVLGALPGLAAGRWATRHASWWCTFEHELTHAVVGLPFGFIPYRFIVTADRGGLVRMFTVPVPWVVRPFQVVGGHVMRLAPYCVPLLALGGVVTAPLLGAWSHPAGFAVGIGFLSGYHLYTNLFELRHNASPRLFPSADGQLVHGDIAQSGYLLSATMIPAVALLVSTVIATLLAGGGWVGVAHACETMAQHAAGTAAWLVRAIWARGSA